MILCLKPQSTPITQTHAHPCLFAEGISSWNVTIVMQSVSQLCSVLIGVQGNMYLHTSLSRRGSEIAKRCEYHRYVEGQCALSTSAGFKVIQYMSFSTPTFPQSPHMVLVWSFPLDHGSSSESCVHARKTCVG